MATTPTPTTGKEETKKDVIIRPMKKEDEVDVAEIWLEGLSQTADSMFVLFRPTTQNKMKLYGEAATSEAGDIGPNGSKLMEFWGNKDDRVMLVACLSEEPDKVVGAVGVKKGASYSDKEPESTQASLWRMSASSQVRRRGLGEKLMQAADEWARDKYHCTSMGPWTSNGIAAKFYCEKGGFELSPGQVEWYDAFSPIAKPLQYAKNL